MRRDVIANVFLFFTLLSLLLVFRYPVYFSYDQVIYRAVSIPERIFSVVFILLWIALCVYSAYFKKIYLIIGGILFGLMPYMPEFLIPMLSGTTTAAKPDLITTLTVSLLKRIYELVNAPFVGVSVLFPPEKAIGFSKMLLPALIISYIGTQLFRFYRNAYLAEKLRLDDTTYSGSTIAAKVASASGKALKDPRQGTRLPTPDLTIAPSPELEQTTEVVPSPALDEPIAAEPLPDEPILLFPPAEAVPSADIIFDKPSPVSPADLGEDGDVIDLDRTVIHLPQKQPARKKRVEKPTENNTAETDL